MNTVYQFSTENLYIFTEDISCFMEGIFAIVAILSSVYVQCAILCTCQSLMVLECVGKHCITPREQWNDPHLNVS